MGNLQFFNISATLIIKPPSQTKVNDFQPKIGIGTAKRIHPNILTRRQIDFEHELFCMNIPGEKDVVGLDVQMDNVLAMYEFKTLQKDILTRISCVHNILENMRHTAPGLFDG